ncbi:multiple sugar transport system permease protein [Geosporobacter subterraneus DSM 17957]|uniref:Multiple sugar transport system permease protein n=1 Tax=Geosporobacter subterraneus DSM 17957 TaxID=1121919 RepID=A0A1M6L5I5_9FIRM|nr:carbohydrate ABC transporter permease [Geosporobacter subterraneus]SHJ66460.1 multiple sugar transport system permease protein [Geosporobacter subterraneus DSM 17957]
MINKKAERLFGAAIVLYLLIIIFPFIWVFLTSLKPESEIWGAGAFKILADQPTFEHYEALFRGNILNALKNSLIISTITTTYVTMVAAIAAYAIARLKFVGKRLILAIVLATSMFPQITVVGPIYQLFVKLNWTNSYFISLPYSMIALPVAIYILVIHFNKVPKEMEESAKIDGASKMKTFTDIILPLALPGIFTAAIITFISVWNEFLLALTLNPDSSYHTATVAITFLRGQFQIFWGQVTAATVVVTIPTLIIVILFQRQIISGLTSGAVKE